MQALISPSPGLNAVLTPACAVPISGGRRRGLAVLLRGLVLAVWLAVPAEAQVLVSNLGQADSDNTVSSSPVAQDYGFFGYRRFGNAQGFTTGSHAEGYRLSSVEIEFSRFDTGIEFSVTVRSSSGSQPGTVLGTLTKPAFSAFSDDTVLTFSAAAGGILLAANTEYFVVVDATGHTGKPVAQWRITESDNEDSGAAAGWTIGNEHLYRTNFNSSDSGISNDWNANLLPSSLKLRINGSEASPRITVQPGTSPVTEGAAAEFTVTADVAPSSMLTVQLEVADASGSDFVDAGNEGGKTVTIPADASSVTYQVATRADSTDEPDGPVTMTIGTGTGYEVGSSSTATVTVTDDDPTTVELTGSDLSMFEGDASNTAVLTVTLGRQLVAGEVVVAPLVLASATGARLPGSTDGGGDPDNDFTVSASGTGVALTEANTANPVLTFTGHDTNTVQTATVTLTPVANRDDGDSADETVTARLASNSVLGASGSGTTVGGGAARHATNFQVSVAMLDNEGGGVTFAVSEVRLLETGSAIYTVSLDAQPTSNVTMAITREGTNSGAATVSPSSHTFTSGTNGTWDDPVTITVTGSDQSGTNANRELTLSHAFASTDSRYGGMNRTVAVKVDDAPEVEAWEGWKWNHGALDPNRKMERPRTVTSTPGLSLGQDIVAGPLDYVIRLSNRPETGGTVTVTATVGDSNLAGISLTRDGAPQNSLTLTFSDRDPSPHCDNSHHDGGGEDHDNTPETSWQCWRKVWVHDLAAGKTGVRGCTDITHTATGGGVRGMTGPYSWSAGTIRAHMMSQSRQGPNGQEFRCPMITGKSSSPGMGSQNSALQVAGPPTDPVANLQLAALDASSAKATWDAVAGATGYRVEWEATDGLNVVAGVQDGVTETA
ncbi:MAG: hypothetical protein F4201_00795, partial [Nitrospira sp. SB0677_bin_15]|nr:hypothetical protein [Nitrospira sp. SB0677_bin_15]